MTFFETTVDHLIPERLLEEKTELNRIITELRLPDTFAVNDYCNWIPMHDRCNKNKAAEVFRATPLIQSLLDQLLERAPKVRARVDRLKSDRKKDALLAKLTIAVESGSLTKAEVFEVLSEPHFDADADLKTLKDTLIAELEDARSALTEFQCPHCKAPLFDRGVKPLSHDCDVLYEVFQCGYEAEDGQMARPCPSDPDFPSFGDYDLSLVKLDGRETWLCRAIPKTKMARRIPLNTTTGDTQEEACLRLKEQYSRKTNAAF